MMSSVYRDVVLILIGGAINWICAWFYYKRAGDELRKEAAFLQKATSAIIYFLEHPEAEVKVQRDDAGRAIGLIVSAEARARGTSTAKGVTSDATATPNQIAFVLVRFIIAV